MDNKKISVCMLSYNHAKYIAQAIEGVLSQETNYSYELIISDDYSTDDTRKILQQYKSQYPDRITLLLPEVNLGMMNNFIHLLSNSHGEYIALCEGDDYWIDKNKLQTQVEFLEKNKNYSIAFHRVYEQIGALKKVSDDNPWVVEMTFDILGITNGNFMHTNSVVYRNRLFESFPSWFHKAPIGDYTLHLLNARYGLIKYFPQIMGVYRKMSGTWSSQTQAVQLKKVVLALNYLDKEIFPTNVTAALGRYKAQLFNEYCMIKMQNNDFSFVEDMDDFLQNENLFIRKWMLDYYPNRMQALLNSKTYKTGKILSKLKEILTVW